MYDRIVVLLDGSELAEQVLPHVAEIARGRGSELHLLSIIPTTVPMVAAGVDAYPLRMSAELLALETMERERVEDELDAYLREVAERLADVAASTRVVTRFGRPAEEILQYAEEVGADLIAMSTHGRSGISRWVYGSVADKVLRGAHCPVLLVRVRPSARGENAAD